MNRQKSVFKDVELTGGLQGRGSVRVEPGRLAVRRGGRYAPAILLATLVLVGIVVALMVVYHSPALRGGGVVGVIIVVVCLVAIFGVRVFLGAIWAPESTRPVVTSQEYDVLPAGGAALGEPNELRFTSRQPRRDLEELILRFERSEDVRRCYEVFTGEAEPQAAEA